MYSCKVHKYSQAIQTTLDRDGVFYISQLGMCWEVLWVKSWGLSPLPSVDVEVCTVFIIDKILFYIYNSIYNKLTRVHEFICTF
jgi:hypothetical protein